MVSKTMLALVAGGLMVATTSAAAQTAPVSALSTAAFLQDDGMEGEGPNTTAIVAAVFGLVVAGILIATAGSRDDDDDGAPVSP